MKSRRTWVLLADGSHARIYENDGVGKGITPLPDGTFDEPVLSTREINADKPGLSFGSTGISRRRMQPRTDPHRQAKFEFARQLASFLEHGHNDNRFDRLVLVAPPKALGDLRELLPVPVRNLVCGELAKDLLPLDERDLPDHLNDLLAL